MSYSAKIILDSIAPCGVRLTTFEIQIPKFIQAELNTHRLLSRNSASTRAIPTAKLIERVMTDPVMPVYWGKNQAGMQAREELTGDWRRDAERQWLAGRDRAVETVRNLLSLQLHKQIAGRILEPWMFTTVIVTATEWDNFFAQRCHVDAQPEFRHVAEMMHDERVKSASRELRLGEWHTPYVSDQEKHQYANDNEDFEYPASQDVRDTFWCKVSAGRCARVSYLTHDGKRDPDEDVALHERLRSASPGHWSPFEHVAQALDGPIPSGNFRGWKQYRKCFPAEHVGGQRP